MQIDITARRWFSESNTYHSVTVWIDNKEIGRNPFKYGYERHYEQTALDMINKHLGTEYTINEIFHSMYRAEGLTVNSQVSDVNRKKDL